MSAPRPLDFIFMLTRDDRTVEDAARHLDIALEAGVRRIGFKDVGLPFAALKDLTATIQSAGARACLEVVSLDLGSELASVRAALDLGVDDLLGGVHVDEVLPILEGALIGYFPFAGRVVGHPGLLEGDEAEIAENARRRVAPAGVTGLDLLAYRSRVNAPALIEAVCAAVCKPVIVAGSVYRGAQVEQIRAAGAAGFTVGTAALDGRFPAQGADLHSQLRAIMAAAEGGESR